MALDLCRAEELFFSSPDSPLKSMALEAYYEVVRFQHALNDPLYQYCGGRATRAAILCRNADIDRLRNEVKELKKLLQERSTLK